jgi:hypothetical protein
MDKKVLYGGIGGIGCLLLLIILAVGAGGGWYYFNEQRKENEREAIRGLQNIADAQNNFFLKKANFKYGTFDELKSAGLLNSYGDWLQDGSHGYRAKIQIDGVVWTAVAEPKSYGFFDGQRSFIVTGDGKVHARNGAGATLTDPVASAY